MGTGALGPSLLGQQSECSKDLEWGFDNEQGSRGFELFLWERPGFRNHFHKWASCIEWGLERNHPQHRVATGPWPPAAKEFMLISRTLQTPWQLS